MKQLITLSLFLVFLFTSCSYTAGKEIHESWIEKIKVNEMTKEEIIYYFGDPQAQTKQVIDGKENETLTYSYVALNQKLLSIDVNTKVLSLYFEGDTLRSYTYNNTASPAPNK